MPSYTLSPIGGAGAQFFDNNGDLLSGGKLYTYAAGTTTPLTTYTTPAGSTPNTNPIVLDAAGRPPQEIWLSQANTYKFILKTNTDVLLATYDNIPGLPPPAIFNDASGISYEQGHIVSAGSFVVGQTYMIATVGTTDFTAIGAVYNSAGTIFTATGVGSGTGTAYVSQTVQSKLQQYISAKDFGAVGDGVADDTAALQAALTYFKTHGNPILLDGNFRITAPLVYQTQGNSTGLRLIGTGASNSSIIGDFSGVNLIEIDGSSIQRNRFQYGGGFEDLKLTVAGGATIENAIKVNGWWFANHCNLQIGELGSATFTKNGIFIPLRNDIDTNPDFYASIGWTLEDVVIDTMGEYGVYGANNTGYSSWMIRGGSFNRNGLDGLYINTNGWRVENASVSYNGRYGLNYDGSVGVTLTDGYFAQLEVDGNATAGIRISRVNSGIFENIRFISRVLNAAEKQLTHVLGDNTQVCTSVKFINSYHRIETGVTSAVKIFDFGAASANISGNTINGYYVLNSAGVTVTDFSDSLLDRRYKNWLSDRAGAQKTASPTKFAHASASSQAITNVLSTWIFNLSVYPTGWSDYNTTTGELTVPHNGFYVFSVVFTCSTIPTNEQFIVNLVKNGVTQQFWYWDWPAGVGADRWSFTATDLLDVVTGDIVKIQVVNTSGTATLFGTAKLSIYAI